MTAGPDAVTGRSRLWMPALGALAVLSLVAEAALVLPAREWLAGLAEWVRDAGPTGALVYACVYLAVTILLLPGSVLTVGAGFAYGPLLGTLLVSPISVAAATVAFLLGRTVLRGAVANRAAADPRFHAIDAAIGAHGFRIVFLLRLSPLVPFGMLNYALGLTAVRLRDYVAASFVGMLPATFLFVYLGSLVRDVATLARGDLAGGTLRQVSAGVGLAATVAVVVALTRVARRALTRELHQPDPPARTAQS